MAFRLERKTTNTPALCVCGTAEWLPQDFCIDRQVPISQEVMCFRKHFKINWPIMIALRGKQLVCKALLIHWEFLEGLSECVWRRTFLLSSSIRLNQPLALQFYKTRVKRHLRRCFLCRGYNLSGTSFQLGGFASPPSSTSSLPPLFLPSFVFFSLPCFLPHFLNYSSSHS